jgi:hypothetical protein
MRISFPGAFLILVLSSVLVSCSSTSEVFQLSADEQASMQTAMAQPLIFVVAREHAIDSWDRAQDFVNRYSTMKLHTGTDSLVTTYEQPPADPTALQTSSTIRYGYSVSRARDPEGVRYQVQCAPSNPSGSKDAEQNAHIAAYYILTGTVCDRCIVR